MSFKVYVLLVGLALAGSSCSLKRMAITQVANALSAPGGSTVFTGDNDPELVGDALPFAIKMYESLMDALPRHRGIRLRTGSLYVIYANAFLQTPAQMLTVAEYQKQEFALKRAKNLYLRGRDILLAALEQRYPGLQKALQAKRYGPLLRRMRPDDVPFLYWAGAGWLGAYAIDPFDMELGLRLPAAAALMNRVRELDERFGDGAIHDFYVLYYGSLPTYMGGDFAKARVHFRRALELSGGKTTSPYLSLATTVCIKEQNLDEFKSLMNKVLQVNPDADPANRLLNTINQRKARWYLEHLEDFFLATENPDNGVKK